MKHVTILTTLLFLFLHAGNAQDYASLINEAENYFYQGNFTAAADRYEEAFRSGRSSDIHLYEAACAWAKAGNPDNALTKLRQAVERGWMALDALQGDPDLVSLHGKPGWQALIGDLTARITAFQSGFDLGLVAQLEDIEERDQRYRKEIRQGGVDQATLADLEARQAELDAENLAAVESIISIYGYPGKSLVGNKCEVVFMVIRNADLETQKYYLPLLEEAATRDDIPWFSFMRLVDQIDTLEGRLQLYGSTANPLDWENRIDLSPAMADDFRAVAAGEFRRRSARWDVDARYTNPSSNDRR